MLPKASITNSLVYWVTVPISNIALIYILARYLLYYKCAILKFTFKRISSNIHKKLQNVYVLTGLMTIYHLPLVSFFNV